MSAMSTPSPTLAARWTTTSVPGRSRSRSWASRTSPTTRPAGGVRSRCTSGRRLSRTTGSSPASARAETTAVPMKPAPPVTNTRRTDPPAPGTLHGNSRAGRDLGSAAGQVVDARQLARLDQVFGEVAQLPVRVLAHDTQEVEGLGRRQPEALDEDPDRRPRGAVALQRDLEVVRPVGVGRC